MTDEELVKKLHGIHVPPSAYSLDGVLLSDKVIRQNIYGKWNVFYFERGDCSYERIFTSKEEANNYVYELLAQDAEQYRDVFESKRNRIFEQYDSGKLYTLEINYSNGGIFLLTYQNNELLNEELIADTYEKAITEAYKTYGLNPYVWKEKYDI